MFIEKNASKQHNHLIFIWQLSDSKIIYTLLQSINTFEMTSHKGKLDKINMVVFHTETSYAF